MRVFIRVPAINAIYGTTDSGQGIYMYDNIDIIMYFLRNPQDFEELI